MTQNITSRGPLAFLLRPLVKRVGTTVRQYAIRTGFGDVAHGVVLNLNRRNVFWRV